MPDAVICRVADVLLRALDGADPGPPPASASGLETV
jgi:hypothetical protein